MDRLFSLAGLGETAGVIQLQGIVGNQAVERLLASSRGGPPAGAASPSTGGRPLAAAVRGKMEAAFGADFSDVRVFEGPHVTAIGAHAFTRGTDIHFAPRSYDPMSRAGQSLLGHELTHVVQQRSGRVSASGATGLPINVDPILEREADVVGERAARGERAVVRGAGAGLQRKAMRGGDGIIQGKWFADLLAGFLEGVAKAAASEQIHQALIQHLEQIQQQLLAAMQRALHDPRLQGYLRNLLLAGNLKDLAIQIAKGYVRRAGASLRQALNDLRQHFPNLQITDDLLQSLLPASFTARLQALLESRWLQEMVDVVTAAGSAAALEVGGFVAGQWIGGRLRQMGTQAIHDAGNAVLEGANVTTEQLVDVANRAKDTVGDLPIPGKNPLRRAGKYVGKKTYEAVRGQPQHLPSTTEPAQQALEESKQAFGDQMATAEARGAIAALIYQAYVILSAVSEEDKTSGKVEKLTEALVGALGSAGANAVLAAAVAGTVPAIPAIAAGAAGGVVAQRLLGNAIASFSGAVGGALDRAGDTTLGRPVRKMLQAGQMTVDFLLLGTSQITSRLPLGGGEEARRASFGRFMRSGDRVFGYESPNEEQEQEQEQQEEVKQPEAACSVEELPEEFWQLLIELAQTQQAPVADREEKTPAREQRAPSLTEILTRRWTLSPFLAQEQQRRMSASAGAPAPGPVGLSLLSQFAAPPEALPPESEALPPEEEKAPAPSSPLPAEQQREEQPPVRRVTLPPAKPSQRAVIRTLGDLQPASSAAATKRKGIHTLADFQREEAAQESAGDALSSPWPRQEETPALSSPWPRQQEEKEREAPESVRIAQMLDVQGRVHTTSGAVGPTPRAPRAPAPARRPPVVDPVEREAAAELQSLRSNWTEEALAEFIRRRAGTHAAEQAQVSLAWMRHPG